MEDAFSVRPGGCGWSWDATETQRWTEKKTGTNKGWERGGRSAGRGGDGDGDGMGGQYKEDEVGWDVVLHEL